jgi:hypothetical protein
VLSLVVGNDNDAGPGSLRQALADANSVRGTNTITFDAVVFATAKTIILSSGQLSVTESLVVNGPGSASLTINGNNASRVFNIFGAPSSFDVTITDLIITQGQTSAGLSGGGIASGANLTLERCVITGNSSVSRAGGVSPLPCQLDAN